MNEKSKIGNKLSRRNRNLPDFLRDYGSVVSLEYEGSGNKKWVSTIAFLGSIFGFISLATPIWTHEVYVEGFSGQFHLTWFSYFTSGDLGEAWDSLGAPMPIGALFGLMILLGSFLCIAAFIGCVANIEFLKGKQGKLAIIGGILVLIAPLLFWAFCSAMDLNSFYTLLYGYPWDDSTGNIALFGSTVEYGTYVYTFTWYISMFQLIAVFGGVFGLSGGAYIMKNRDYFSLEAYTKSAPKKGYQSPYYSGRRQTYQPQSISPTYEGQRPPYQSYQQRPIPYQATNSKSQEYPTRPAKSALSDQTRSQTEKRPPIKGKDVFDTLKLMLDNGMISLEDYNRLKESLE